MGSKALNIDLHLYSNITLKVGNLWLYFLCVACNTENNAKQKEKKKSP